MKEPCAICGQLRRLNAAAECRDCAMPHDLNHWYRHGGDIKEDAEPGRDTISEMKLIAASRHALSDQLKRMGIGEDGNEPEEE